MPTVDQFVERFGKQSYLAVSLIAYLLTDALFPGNRVLTYTILAMLIVSGPLATARTRLHRFGSIGLALLMVAAGYLSVVLADARISLAAHLIAAAFFLHLIGTISRGLLLEQTRVTGETLWAAVNIYILFGLFFAFLYSAVLLSWPDAFAGGMLENRHPLPTQSMVYYSFVTMTTLGYGDITPKIRIAATLAYVQALIGQLYVAILIARLVSMYNAPDVRKEE